MQCLHGNWRKRQDKLIVMFGRGLGPVVEYLRLMMIKRWQTEEITIEFTDKEEQES